MSEFYVHFYRDENDRHPVRDYLDHLARREKSKALAYINQLGEAGLRMRRPMADYLGNQTGLYELRPKQHRIIYCYVGGKKIILLHAFEKRMDQIPKIELERALVRKEIAETFQRYDIIDYESDL